MQYLAALDLLNQSKNNLPQAKSNIVQIVLNDLFVIIGALAILMVIISGFRLVFARGNPERITSARNNIMYSLIGLAIAALASTIVNVVVGKVTP